jgi:probable phosphoglycerate mutase
MTEFDLSHRLKGRLDIPLCPLGIEQATDVAEQIIQSGPIDALYTAPCQASRQTAGQFALLCDVKPRICQELVNLDMGLWSGLCLDDIRQRQPTIYRRWQENPETVCPPQGEMLFEGRQRVHEAVARMAKKYHRGRIVLIIPEPLATISCCHLRGAPVCDLWKTENNFGTFESIEYQSSSVAARRP